MADISKAEKLAAARKKLKEFQNQQKNKDTQEQRLYVQSKTEEFQLNGNKPEEKITETKLQESLPKSEVTEPPSLVNYFSYGGKSSSFFETLQKSNSEESKESNGNDFFYMDKSSSSSLPEESNITHVTNNNSSCVSLTEDDSSKYKTNEEELLNLRQEFDNAVTKIKMQADALDIVTNDREELDKKLGLANKEIMFQKEMVASFQNRIEENEKNQLQLNDIINELRQFKDEAIAKENYFLKNINDLNIRNDELEQTLEMQKEKYSSLQKKFEDVQSYKDVLTLKFQQLGIELEGDNQNLVFINEERDQLRNKLAETQEQLKVLLYEKEHTDDNYREYVENLKTELHQISIELQRISAEKEILTEKLSSQTDHISSLEKLLQKPQKQVADEQKISDLEAEIQKLREQIEEKTKKNEYLQIQMEDYISLQEKLRSLENEIETMRTEMKDAQELQAVVESNKVAASQAIGQNSKLKEELVRLTACVEDLNKDKDVLKKLLEEEKNKNDEYSSMLSAQSSTCNNQANKTDAETNTDKNSDSDQNPYGTANLDAMLQLQEKFKCVLNKMADLTDEKQQLEHLVLQLQCETETIEEYVALYQKQRSLLHQRARETDLKVEKMNKEKQQLQNIIRTILTFNNIDSDVVKQFVEKTIPPELRQELFLISNEVNGNVYSSEFKNDNSHHPSCPCCSGKLITI